MLLEAYRECLRDVFDIPAFLEILRAIEKRQIRVHVADSRTPSPFASSLLFSYVANYIYEGDAPLAERRAQALSIDQEQLQDLLGDADLRELLDAEAIADVEEQLQALGETQRVRSVDGMHDLLLRLGDLSRAELGQRLASPDLMQSVDRLLRARRILEVKIAGEKRLIAVEDAARYRDALRHSPSARNCASPSRARCVACAGARSSICAHSRAIRIAGGRQPIWVDAQPIEAALHTLVLDGRIIEGGFRPAGVHREWCDAEVLRQIRRKSLARLRKEIEPVEQQMLSRLQTHWQGILQRRRGLDALLDTIEHLQGAPLPASLVESAILPARLQKYSPGDLDTLIAAGEVVWCGLDSLGERDGRIGLYLADKMATLCFHPRNQREGPSFSEKEQAILDQLTRSGAMFFAQLHEMLGGGYPGETLDALWTLVWRGLITNDTFHALRAYVARPSSARPAKRQHNLSTFRSRRTTPPSAQGRWVLVAQPDRTTPAVTDSMEPCPRAAIAEPIWHSKPRNRGTGERSRRLQRRLRCA